MEIHERLRGKSRKLAAQSKGSSEAARRKSNREEIKRLEANRWVSTGSAPYKLEMVAKSNLSALSYFVTGYVKKIQREKEAEYLKANIKRIGFRTFLSPSLYALIAEAAIARFGKRK
jgi:hypothetical protein